LLALLEPALDVVQVEADVATEPHMGDRLVPRRFEDPCLRDIEALSNFAGGEEALVHPESPRETDDHDEGDEMRAFGFAIDDDDEWSKGLELSEVTLLLSGGEEDLRRIHAFITEVFTERAGNVETRLEWHIHLREPRRLVERGRVRSDHRLAARTRS
jgi:hypothetical protein